MPGSSAPDDPAPTVARGRHSETGGRPEGSEPSLQVVAEQVSQERSLLTAHAEAYDGKAGILLGFAGVIIAVSVSDRSTLVRLALGCAAVSSLIGILVLVRRRRPFRMIDVDRLTERCGQSDAQTRHQVLVAEQGIVRELEGELERRSLLLLLAFALLVLAMLLLLAANLAG
ncbi:MAG: hypothetical protein ACRDZ8_06235 [Acidimicrobiales bacterium]